MVEYFQEVTSDGCQIKEGPCTKSSKIN